MQPSITIKDFTENSITLLVNGQEQVLSIDENTFKAFFQKQRQGTFQLGEKIYNIEHINNAYFHLIFKEIENGIKEINKNNTQIEGNNNIVIPNTQNSNITINQNIQNAIIPAPLTINDFKEQSIYLLSQKNTLSQIGLHIPRTETTDILAWLDNPISAKKRNICCLVGRAGIGKTIILHDVAKELAERRIPFLALKADRQGEINAPEIIQAFQILQNQYDLLVLILDQIDALSTTLSQDRSSIKQYTDLINILGCEEDNRIRIIFSCREFDLKHDPNLSQYEKANDLTRIDTSYLSEKVIKDACNQLGINRLSKQLLDLLKTPLHLEVFCRIYDKDLNLDELTTLTHLYDKFWERNVLLKTDKEIPKGINSQEIYALITEIAEKMDKKQQLSISSRLYETQNALHYLCTEGILLENEKRIGFFHQSFFDYVFARHFVEKEKSLSDKIALAHQGLFVRPQIRQVLTYLKDSDGDRYISELKQILSNKDKYRFHIRQLIVQHLASETNLLPKEKHLFKHIIYTDEDYLYAFTQAIDGMAWVKYLCENEDFIQKFLGQENTPIYQNCLFLLRRYAHSEPDFILEIIDKLPEFPYKGKIVESVTHNISKEQNNPLMCQLFEKYYADFKGYHAITSLLELCIKHFPEWVKAQVLRYVKDITNLRFDYELVNFLKKFTQSHIDTPYKHFPYEICKEILLYQIDKAKFPTEKDEYLIQDQIYWTEVPDIEKEHTLFGMILTHFKLHIEKDVAFAQKEVKDLLALPYLTIHKLALEILVAFPRELLPVTTQHLFQCSFLQDYPKYQSLGETDYYEHLVKEVLENTFPLLNTSQKNGMIAILLSLRFDEHELHKYKRDGKKKYYLEFGIHQYKLLQMLPPLEITQHTTLKKRFQELERRFPKPINNKRPTEMGFAPVHNKMNDKAYKNMDLIDWEKAMRKYEKDEQNFDDKPNAEGNSRAFKEKVKENPSYFLPLIEKCITDNTINSAYAWQGLEGLKEAKYDALKVKDLFKQFRSLKKEEKVQRRMLWLISYFIENKCMDTDLFVFLAEQACENTDIGRGEINNAQDAAMRYSNSIQGCAIENLLKCSDYPEAIPFIYDSLEKIIQKNELHPRAATIAYIAYLGNIDKNKAVEVFLQLCHNYENEVVISATNIFCVHYLIHYDFEKLIPYFEKVIEIESIYEQITTYLFHAWLYHYTESKRLLDQILLKQPKSKITAMRVACANIADIQYETKCKQMIHHLLQFDEKEIGNEFEYELFLRREKEGSIHFEKHYDLIYAFVTSPAGKYRGPLFYEALLDNTKTSPQRCTTLTALFGNEAIKDKYQHKPSEPFNVIIEAYNQLKQIGEEDGLDEALDVFDKMLRLPNYRDYGLAVLSQADIR